jgi:hypothetical protein
VTLVVIRLAAIHAFQQAADPRTQPETAVKEAIRLLDAKKFVDFLETFARPGEVEELTAKAPIEEVAKEFGERRAPDLLSALRAASTMKPTLNQDATRADYRFEKPFGRERRISMVKIGEFWYLR